MIIYPISPLVGTLQAEGYSVSSAAIINDGGTSRSLSGSDNGKTIVFSSNSDINVTVPTGLGAGYNISCIQTGLGNVTYVASGTTLNALGGTLTASGQHAVSSIFATAANTFNVLVGGGAGTGGSGTLTDGDKGDIIVSGAASALIFDENIVTAYSRTLLASTGAPTWRTGLGLGSAALSATGAFAASSHTHAGTDITTGIINVARLGTGVLNQNTYLNGLGGFVSGFGVADGDKGDITVSGSGTVYTVDPLTITYAKMQAVSGIFLVGYGNHPSSGIHEQLQIGTGLSVSGSTISVIPQTVDVGDYTDIVVTGAGDWRLDPNINIVAATVTSRNELEAGNFSSISWSGSTQMFGITDGYLLLTNNAGTNFDCIQFGGVTAAFPAISKSGVELKFTVASDPNGYTPIRASGVTADTYRVTSNNINALFSTTYSLASTDNGKTIVSYTESPVTITVISGLPTGFCCSVIQHGGSPVTISGAAGVTLTSFSGVQTTAGQYATASLFAISPNIYNLAGTLV